MRNSYSRISMYMKCPLQKKYKYDLGMRTPAGPAAERGIGVHSAFEKSVQLQLPLPEEFEFYNEYVKKLEGASCELKLAAGLDWLPTDFDSPDAWILGILDLWKAQGDRGTLLDWKTGKEYPDDHYRQKEFYAGLVFANFPEIEIIDAINVYVDLKKITKHIFTRTDLPDIQDRWANRIRRMEADTECAPSPGPYCRWCDVSKRKGGPCAF